jgi:uncharacterized membrane protein YphA (DoxX/SURF4 family)
MNKHSALYAFGAIALGVIGIVYQDFALQWQPVPKGIAMRTPLAFVSAALLLIGGGALLARKWERAGALLLAAFFGLWVIALHLPRAFASWQHIGAWNAPAEITYLAMGGVALFATGASTLRGTLSRIARMLAGASALVFGLAQVFWAWATGAGHLAAGLALVSGYQARLAATLHAAMMGSFAVLVHLPRVIANPEKHEEWIMLAVSSGLAGSAVLIRKHAT